MNPAAIGGFLLNTRPGRCLLIAVALTPIAIATVVAVGAVVLLGGATASQDAPTTGGCTSTTPDGINITSVAANGPDPRVVDTVIAVGRSLHVPDEGIVVALATGLVESGLHNLDHGDRDSLGVFQQRPSSGWGTPGQITNVTASTRAFYGRADHTTNPGLLDIPGWQHMAVGDAAQAVQRSAFPGAYADREGEARALLSGAITHDDPIQQVVSKSECKTVGADLRTADLSGVSGAAVKAAASQVGVPYSWGGGGPAGPSTGIAQGAGTVGFDCSSLMQYAWSKATHGNVTLPRTTYQQQPATTPVPRDGLAAGDLLFFGPPGGPDHVGMYDGQGGMIHAPRTGKHVEVVPDVFSVGYWSARFAGAGRVR